MVGDPGTQSSSCSPPPNPTSPGQRAGCLLSLFSAVNKPIFPVQAFSSHLIQALHCAFKRGEEKKKKKKPSQPHTFNFLISMPARKVFLQLLEAATKNGPDCVCLKIGTLIPRLNRGWGLWSCWGGPWHSICQGAPQLVLPPPFFGASRDFAEGNFMRC